MKAALQKKHDQLGMNPSTASHRLIKDTLWRLVQQTGNDACHRCGLKMTRETFSVEHKEAWLDSDDPVGNYFDQDNIAFSHLTCNIKDARNGPKIRFGCGTHQKYDRGCRCDPCLAAKSEYRAAKYCPTQRSQRYASTGH